MARDNWGSKFGFIMAAAGSAVGLGNIWRFPYLTGQNGGAAFVLLYIFCAILVAIPMLISEIALGRFTGKNPVGAVKHLTSNKLWIALVGVLPLIVTFVVLSYYSAIAGWTVGYIFTSLFSVEATFSEFIANPAIVVPLAAFVILATTLIVLGGVSGGIEKAAKILMPLLFVLLVITIFRSVTLPGAEEGIRYYLIPDFSKLSGHVVLAALTQAFFSLGVGWGMMITYGSYLSKKQNIISSSFWVGLMDTSIALLAGLMVFPAVFAFDQSPAEGATLVFSVLANIFPQMPFGNVAGALFFLLLFFAAITSTISMLEAPSAFFIDQRKWSRKKAAWTVAVVAFLFGLPSALSTGAVESLTTFQVDFLGVVKTGFMDVFDYLFGSLLMMLVVMSTCLFTGWFINTNLLVEEIEQGFPKFRTGRFLGIAPYKLWLFAVRFICPIIIGIVILNMVGVFGV